jgi:hypothetical protein
LKPRLDIDETTADLILAWRGNTDDPAYDVAIRHVTGALEDPAWLA